MNSGCRWLGFGVGLLTTVAMAQTAEIVLEHSAVDKLPTKGLFTNRGRFNLQRGVCHVSLENPSGDQKRGRIRIRSHLTARLGIDTGGS